jgi:tRNA(Ile)-lysidine synthetase-like protein
VALLLLLAQRADLKLHVVHLDHQTRGDESTGDAAFVRELARQLKLPATIACRSEIEAGMGELPANPSSRYRAARLALFRQVVEAHHLAGVILAHHADDQTETVLHRLLRGSGPAGLAAMDSSTDLGELRIVRPLLTTTRQTLREFLADRNQAWREDASNAGDDYLRNRLRRWLGSEPDMAAELLELGQACRGLRDWVRSAAPRLGSVSTPDSRDRCRSLRYAEEPDPSRSNPALRSTSETGVTDLRKSLDASFAVESLARLPAMLAGESARAWLIEVGVPPDMLSPAVIERLIAMATDGASPPRAHFPGQILVRRREGRIFVSE